MKRVLWIFLVGALFLGSALLAACGGSGQTSAPGEPPSEAQAQATTPAPESTPTPEPAATPTPSGPPPFTEELHATDPSTVVIGAGQPQVVEFFAFW